MSRTRMTVFWFVGPRKSWNWRMNESQIFSSIICPGISYFQKIYTRKERKSLWAVSLQSGDNATDVTAYTVRSHSLRDESPRRSGRRGEGWWWWGSSVVEEEGGGWGGGGRVHCCHDNPSMSIPLSKPPDWERPTQPFPNDDALPLIHTVTCGRGGQGVVCVCVCVCVCVLYLLWHERWWACPPSLSTASSATPSLVCVRERGGGVHTLVKGLSCLWSLNVNATRSVRCSVLKQWPCSPLTRHSSSADSLSSHCQTPCSPAAGACCIHPAYSESPGQNANETMLNTKHVQRRYVKTCITDTDTDRNRHRHRHRHTTNWHVKSTGSLPQKQSESANRRWKCTGHAL